MDFPPLVGFLNGRFEPLADLQISVLDRGFLFGDGIYEAIPVYNRHPLRLTEHLRRLADSLAAINMPNPYGAEEWASLIQKLIAQQSFADQSVYVQITRGPAFPRNHAFPTVTEPTVFMFADELLPPCKEAVANGVAAVSAADIRWLQCNIKAISLLANVLLKQQAVDAGVAETILFRDGYLQEGASSNILIVKEGVLLAPPPSNLMLTGITYDLVIELAKQHNMPLEVRAILQQEVLGADEVWLTSSSKEVLAVVSLDGKPVANGLPGPLYPMMYDYFQVFKNEAMRLGKDK
ncbi:D-amino acid aminotransferase [Iodobacter sp.]|uniref:D-amino acid aminotransferase n=1 Tax=Iodobacter sp. TaxID=1915058 RepID=UPI0025E69F66|nr:D-amino acid aminotransferase [Iodobacter sp.]